MIQLPEGYILIKKEDDNHLLQTIQNLTARVEESESQFRKNRSNRNKLLSTDIFIKPIKYNRAQNWKHQGAKTGDSIKLVPVFSEQKQNSNTVS